MKRSLELNRILTEQVLGQANKDGDSRPQQVKIIFQSSQLAAATLEAFRVNKYR